MLLLAATLLLLFTRGMNALPECELDTEVEFYESDITVDGLSESCSSEMDLGFLIQDVVYSADYQMREYQEEYMHTNVSACFLPSCSLCCSSLK